MNFLPVERIQKAGFSFLKLIRSSTLGTELQVNTYREEKRGLDPIIRLVGQPRQGTTAPRNNQQWTLENLLNGVVG